MLWGRSLGGGVELTRFTRNSAITIRAPTIVRTRSRRTVGATTYTFRFSSSHFVRDNGVPLRRGVNSPTDPYGVSDSAPHLFGTWFYYDLLVGDPGLRR
jgi:hypothetical protein